MSIFKGVFGEVDRGEGDMSNVFKFLCLIQFLKGERAYTFIVYFVIPPF